jgi:hypothetical protein
MIDSEGTKEIAKAVQEVAKTTQSAIEVTKDAGSFIGRFLDGPLTQMSLLIEDRLKYARTTRLLRLRHRLEEELQTLGSSTQIKPLQINFAISALEEGSFEEDDDLQDIWARLLVNAVDARSDVTPRRAHISIIRDMSRLDALVFEAIYSVPDGDTAIVTHELPEKAYRADQQQSKEVPEPSEAIKVSLANLERLGVIAFGSSWGGGEIFRYANKTTAGKDLIKAIQRRTPSSPE